jgi:hypothetical protein
MTYSTQLLLALSTLDATNSLRTSIHDLLERHAELLTNEILAFQCQTPSPTTAFDLEQRLTEGVRALARDLLQQAYNHLEGDDPAVLPSHLRVEGEDYRIVRQKTRHTVDTLFGPITLMRHLYRPVSRHSPEASIVPLEQTLGIVSGTTPALAEAAARYAAEAGATQRVVLDRLRHGHGITMGTERLRELMDQISGKMALTRQKLQADRLLELLDQANRSTGPNKPVLSVGRDGVTLCENQNSLYEVASSATLTILDRRGKRLGTVYLAFAPELGQHQMSDQLTRLIEEVLRRWDGPLPRLTYVTDAGENETQYYRRVLRSMRHPRTGVVLHWQRIIDFYHTMERIWKMAEVLFGRKTREGYAWARKMGRLLKKPNGPFRVLHSAAALRRRRVLGRVKQTDYRKAYNYIRRRTRWMQYHEYARLHLPLGSGITEAACKTVYTQRLKLSGMRWKKAGAQVVLNLRVVLLSGVWQEAYQYILTTFTNVELRTLDRKREIPIQMAA